MSGCPTPAMMIVGQHLAQHGARGEAKRLHDELHRVDDRAVEVEDDGVKA